MPWAGFEPATQATKRPQTYALDSAATGIGLRTYTGILILIKPLHFQYVRILFLATPATHGLMRWHRIHTSHRDEHRARRRSAAVSNGTNPQDLLTMYWSHSTSHMELDSLGNILRYVTVFTRCTGSTAVCRSLIVASKSPNFKTSINVGWVQRD
jgi:hypothetical protein